MGKKLKFYDELIDEYGWKIRPIRLIVRHILNSVYSYTLYPGSSHAQLLISRPKNGQLDFTQTLSIHYNQNRQLLEFRFNSEQTLDWMEDCQASEGIVIFEYFMHWKKDWK